MSPSPELVVPRTIAEACAALTGEDVLAVAGGTAIALLLRSGLVAPERLVWLAKVPALAGIATAADGGLLLGACSTLAEISRDPIVAASCPSLARAAGAAANPRVRAVATLGGHLAHADPRQDLPPVLLALGASVVLEGPAGRRTLPLEEFLVDFMTTSLADDEIVVAVSVPHRAGAKGAGRDGPAAAPSPTAVAARRERYVRFTPNSHDDYPTVGVAVDIGLAADGTVEDVRIALGGVAPTAVLVESAGALLRGTRPTATELDAVADAARAVASPSDDQRGSARYKREMSAVWTRRAVAAALDGEAPA